MPLQQFPIAKEDPTAIMDRTIAPISRNSFLSEYWGKSFLHLVGHKGKFARLLGWEDLNSILEQDRLEASRLRLLRDGQTLDSSMYITGGQDRSRLKPGALINCLSEGATLILDRINELLPTVGQLAEAFQEVLRSQTTVNLYAGWRIQKGFDLHWDPQDTMILQVSGRKHWTVYAPTRPHPLKEDLEPTPKPKGEPVWDGVLKDGDMIYLPRGWWHVAFPLDEPSLHLTVTIVPANGVHLLRWLVEELMRHADVRMNIPHLASDADRKLYVQRLSELLTESWSDSVLERFIAEWEAQIPVRPRIRLPFAPIEGRAPINMETKVRLASSRRVAFTGTPTDGMVSYIASGIRGKCSEDLVPALKQLRGTSSRSVAELCSQLSDESSTSMLMILLTALAMRGALQTEP